NGSSTHMNPDLISKAADARQRAVAPYSGFKVGAAIETHDGRIYTGCNIENASYGLSICAERVALWKALSEGAQDFREMAIVSEAKTLTSPCGACRQLLWEYCGDITVYLRSLRGLAAEHRLSELFRFPFHYRSLQKHSRSGRLENADVRQIPISLSIIEAVTDNELVGNFEPNVFEVDVDNAAGAAIQQCAHFKRLRIPATECAQQIFQCK